MNYFRIGKVSLIGANYTGGSHFFIMSQAGEIQLKICQSALLSYSQPLLGALFHVLVNFTFKLFFPLNIFGFIATFSCALRRLRYQEVSQTKQFPIIKLILSPSHLVEIADEATAYFQ